MFAVVNLNPILGGGGRIPPPPWLFRPWRPESWYKVVVMGYVTLSYYIGKTPEKVSGPKIFFWFGQEAGEVGSVENLSASKTGFFNFQLDFPP